jgi:hypothetical protein
LTAFVMTGGPDEGKRYPRSMISGVRRSVLPPPAPTSRGVSFFYLQRPGRVTIHQGHHPAVGAAL